MFEEYNPADEEVEDSIENDFEDDGNNEELEEQVDGDDSLIPEDNDADGEEDETDVDEEEDLVDIWSRQKQSNQTVQADETANDIARTVASSPLLTEIIKYRNMGYSEDQIALGISRLYQQRQPQQEEQQQYQQNEYEQQQNGQQLNIQQLIQQEIQKALAPVQQQMQTSVSTQKMAATKQHNEKVFKTALNRLGIESLRDDKELQYVSTAIQTLYPGIDLGKHQLSQEQADAIMTLSMKNKVKKQKIGTGKSQNAPNIMGGQVSKASTSTVQQSRGDGASKSERRQNISKLFS